MKTLIKVKDSIGLHREMESGAILNTSSDDYNKYIKQRESMLSQKQRVDKLESDISEIKSMLNQLLLTSKS